MRDVRKRMYVYTHHFSGGAAKAVGISIETDEFEACRCMQRMVKNASFIFRWYACVRMIRQP